MADDNSYESLGPLSSESGRNLQIYAPGHDLIYRDVQQDLVLSRDTLQLLLERVERRGNAARYSDAWRWFGVFLAFLFPMVAADFKDFLFIPASLWSGATLVGILVCAFGSIRTLWLAWSQRADRANSVVQMLDELIADMQTRPGPKV